MTFKDSEGIRLLADHIKSTWALSAGGIAFGSGLLGFISKDVSIPRLAYLICLILVFGGLCAYTYSVWRGIQAHKELTDEVFNSEQVLVTDIDAQRKIKSILAAYYCCRMAFFIGCLSLALGVLGVVAWNNLLRRSKPSSFSVLLKNGSMITQDSRRIEIESLSFQITDPRSLPSQTNAIEIQDFVFKARTLEATR
jgi:hypothetical protein